jgi:hypothetical protein
VDLDYVLVLEVFFWRIGILVLGGALLCMCCIICMINPMCCYVVLGIVGMVVTSLYRVSGVKP